MGPGRYPLLKPDEEEEEEVEGIIETAGTSPGRRGSASEMSITLMGAGPGRRTPPKAAAPCCCCICICCWWCG